MFEAKDGVGAARLLRALARKEADPEKVLELVMSTARAAWDNEQGFHCTSAATLAGFAGRFNDIRAELRKAGRLPGPPGPGAKEGGGW